MAQRIKEPTLSVAYVHSLSQELLHAAGGAKKKKERKKYEACTGYKLSNLYLGLALQGMLNIYLYPVCLLKS